MEGAPQQVLGTYDHHGQINHLLNGMILQAKVGSRFHGLAEFIVLYIPGGVGFVAITRINLIQHIQLAEFVWIVHQQFNFDLFA